MPPVVGIIGAISAGITSALTAATAALSGLVSFAGLGAFLASPIGNIILGIGLQLLISPFLSRRSQQTPTVEAGKINVRVSEPDRWDACGSIRLGGGVVFGEFDDDGNFWYVVIHGDSRHTGITKRFFDDNEIALDGDNWVTTDDFCLDDDMNSYSGSGTKVKFFKLFTTTYTAANPTPPAVADLMAAFPGSSGWTSDHKLVGTTYSVVRISPVDVNNRYKIFKWRGPLGIGEPAVSLVANWSVAYDPRDPTQILGQPSTYKFTRNAALVWAWFRTLKYGRGKPENTIDWEKMKNSANICDLIIFDKNGQPHANWRCDTAIPESKERSSAEQEILMACDGVIIFNEDDGKAWVMPGYYYVPTLKLTRARDIVGMSSVEAQNGESETQGVIVRYLDPDAKYVTNPSAPWLNPLYYVEGETPKFLTVDILTVQDHNQAMRLAKAYGGKSQPKYKTLPTFGLRGMRARQERIIDMNYDNTFAGEHEIVTPVEVDETGVFCGFGVVPADPNRWTLLPGEEKNKPVFSDGLTTGVPALPTGVVVSFTGSRIEATWGTPRKDVTYEFQLKKASESVWIDMVVKMKDILAYSGGVSQNIDYNVRWRTRAQSGKVSLYVSPVVTINTTILTLTGTAVTTGKVGVAYAGFTVGVSGGTPPYYFSDLYGRLPPGITINSATGAISGTPTTAGTYANIIIRVFDSESGFANRAPFTITVAP